MAEQQIAITVPEGVKVRCPLTGPSPFMLRAIAKCKGCEHYRGLQEMLGNYPQNRKPFTQCFAVKCAFPNERQLFEVEG